MAAISSSPPSEEDLRRGRACHAHAAVRGEVARDASTPSYLLKRLAYDPDSSVRAAVARNEATPGPVLEGLLQDSACNVLVAAIRNPRTPKSPLGHRARRTDLAPHVLEALRTRGGSNVGI